MGRTIVFGLVLPLTVAIALVVAAYLIWGPVDGLLVSLGTTLLGILVTVVYVDWILGEHDKRRWQSTDVRIANRLRILLNGTVSGIRDGIGFGPEILGDLSPFEPISMHQKVMLVAESVIAPAIDAQVKSLDQKGWAALARQIQNSQNGILSFFGAFQTRLDPEQISLLLDLQESLSRSVGYWNVFPDVMGVPADQLPKKKTPANVLQAAGCDSTIKELQKSLGLARKLSNTLPEGLSP